LALTGSTMTIGVIADDLIAEKTAEKKSAEETKIVKPIRSPKEASQ
jgi:hypothetical protein